MPAFYVRVGQAADIPAIMSIIDSAKSFLHQQNIDQWQGTYPDQPAVAQDVANGTNRVLVMDGQVVGTGSLIEGPDPFYLPIEGEGWAGEADYMMIHRFALSDQVRGHHLSQLFLSNLLSEAYTRGYRDVRIDTHAENVIMQAAITGNGFTYRGVVRLDEPVPERNAYQLIMD